jgi:hypothetical protein
MKTYEQGIWKGIAIGFVFGSLMLGVCGVAAGYFIGEGQVHKTLNIGIFQKQNETYLHIIQNHFNELRPKKK